MPTKLEGPQASAQKVFSGICLYQLERSVYDTQKKEKTGYKKDGSVFLRNGSSTTVIVSREVMSTQGRGLAVVKNRKKKTISLEPKDVAVYVMQGETFSELISRYKRGNNTQPDK